MIHRIRLNGEYYIDNAFVKVIERKINPWMPDTIKVRLSNGETKTYSAPQFRKHATEKRD